jgi:hypothetical protein
LLSPPRLARIARWPRPSTFTPRRRSCRSSSRAIAERGEKITIARDGKPVAQLGPAPRARKSSLPPEDPLLNLDEFAVDGAGGELTNVEIDRILYGGS